jgi:protein-disulfide isomerase
MASIGFRRVAERVWNVTLGLIVVIMVAMYIYKPTSPRVRPLKAPENWRDYVVTGIVFGTDNPVLTLVQFMDYQCPYCASWAARVDSLLAEAPDKVQVAFHHFPLTSIHPHAVAAAVVSECAHRQDRFVEMSRALFSRQKEIGERPWTEFAQDAGVPDVATFEACTLLPSDSFPRIAYGSDVGQKTGVMGTPTVWVNGSVLKPTLAEFRALLDPKGTALNGSDQK